MEFFDIEDNRKKVHFIGVGGVNMSALALFLRAKGFRVSGSDRAESPATMRLEDSGVEVYIGHSESNVEGADLVVYTDAISMDNEELKAAIKSKIDIVDRAEFLGVFMKNFDFSIGISGTHGKTSTTSMVTEIIYDDVADPTIMLGGTLDKIGGNIQIGGTEKFLTEACEYKGNIKKYHPTLGVVLNIDEDHLDYFDNIDHIIKTFEEFGENLDENSILLMNGDDENSKTLADHTKGKVLTFGIDKIADYSAKNIKYDSGGFPTFDVFKGHRNQGTVTLQILGIHNIYNSVAAIAIGDIYGVDMEKILERISQYTGVDRRLELKGVSRGVDILDDYAHHPTEIKLTLEAVRNRYSSDIYCVFQPHTFTRTRILLDKFSTSFCDADNIIITDIFAAREKDYGDIHSKMLVDAINKNGKNAIYLETFEEVEEYLLENTKPGDCVITMGAGDVYKIGENILKHTT